MVEQLWSLAAVVVGAALVSACRLVQLRKHWQIIRMRVTKSAVRAILSIFVTGMLSPALAMQPIKRSPTFPLASHIVTDKFGRTITYYLSKPTQRAPILLMIQGSGCATVLRGSGTGRYSTLFDLLPFASEGRFAVMAVEKPFSSTSTKGGTADDCSAVFNSDFTAERWLVALRAAIADARHQPNVDPHKMIVLGASEGAVMASLLAGRDDRVTDVIAVGGSGTTQLYDFMVWAYTGCFNRSACIARVEQQVEAIHKSPDSATQFAWGHPYRRWTSFFAIDSGEELLRSKARVYLAFGTSDAGTPPLSQEVAVARLLAAGRDVTVRRVLDADHSLVPPGGDFSALDKEYRRALDWYSMTPQR